ncbi:MAG: lytic transglycosylase domain-containing protein [Chitinophagales bacterium]
MKKKFIAAVISVIFPLSAGTVSLDADVATLTTMEAENPTHNLADLYLIEEAKEHTDDHGVFERKVRIMARNMNVPPEWIMAVIHAESRFNPKVKNYKGSGARGLIQWMPHVYKEMGVQKLPTAAVDQLDLVEQYLCERQAEVGTYKSLTDLRLAILYPVAVGKSQNYALYSKPSLAYEQNIGLDMNKDGKVTVKDIAQKMKREYKDAFEIHLN